MNNAPDSGNTRWRVLNEPGLRPKLALHKPVQMKPSGQALATWNIPAAEWKKYAKQERRERRSEILAGFCGIVALGTPMLHWLRSASWISAMAISALVAASYAGLVYWLRIFPLGEKAGGRVVHIFSNGVDMNGQWTGWDEKGRRRGKIQLLEHRDPIVMEITYHWQTRRGPAFDEVRIPVPKGSLGDAIRLLDKLQPDPAAAT